MRLSIFASFALVTSFAVAGCAVESDPNENTGETQQDAITDSRLDVAVNSDNNYVVSKDHQIVVNDTRRIDDFSQVPRISQRAPYETNMHEVSQSAIIPHSAHPGVAGQISNGLYALCKSDCANP